MGLVVGRDGLSAHENLLNNSNFIFPVNARGLTTYTGNKYTIDRWRTSDAAAEVKVDSTGLTINKALMQKLKVSELGSLDGKFTAAICSADGVVSCVSGDMAEGFSNDVVEVGYTSEDKDLIAFTITAAGTYRWAALYRGEYDLETLPDYVPKGYAAELLECQRYYMHLPISRQAVYCSATSGAVTLMLPVPMRITPTLTAVKKGQLRCNGSAAITVTAITVAQLDGNTLWLDTTHTSTSDIATYTGSWNGGEIELSADL